MTEMKKTYVDNVGPMETVETVETVDCKPHDGHSDSTPYNALRGINQEKYGKNVRFYKLLHMMFALCDLCGFELIGRVTLKDKRTGKIYK